MEMLLKHISSINWLRAVHLEYYYTCELFFGVPEVHHVALVLYSVLDRLGWMNQSGIDARWFENILGLKT